MRELAYFLALMSVGIFVAIGCQPHEQLKTKGPPLPLTVAVRPALDSGLIAIADEKGYFKEAGLDVSIKPYSAGLLALEAMSRGEAQLATVADIAFATRMVEDNSIRVIASIGYSTGSEVVARKDKGIDSPSELKGKRVGFTSNTTSDYFLYTFLLNEDLSPSEITPVPIPAGRQAQAVIDGEVDAVSAFDVYAFEAKKKLGADVVAWDCQNNLGYQWILAAGQDVAKSPEPVKRFLRALLKAETFLLANEEEAKSIIIRKFGLDPELANDGWPKVRLSLSLNQSVITSLRDFLRWKMHKEGTTGSPPDVVDFIYTGALDDVAPRSVNIFR